MVRPRKTDIVADEVALIWTPWREMADGAVEAAYTWP